MSSDSVRDSTHHDKPISSIFELVMQLGGGMIPESGTYTAKVWAVLLGKDEATVRRYVKQFNVPHRKPGDEMFIDARDFRDHIPIITGSKEK